ncbi:MAG: gamma-glutamyltransferase family protein [Synergistaceae bacterium]|jgi:gamma-glutamyltranspeptidase/glutathione hydrolase|nr:gamma-glutamyltransferase family protein [Synergistaceae bacterium]
MEFNALNYRYPSRRSVVYGSRGMVATGQPLAAQAGLDILKRGGNAVDAAIAAAACLTVVEPTSNGIGSDAFALVWFNGKLRGLNASGFSPKAANASELLSAGFKQIPTLGWYAVTVPGAPSCWAALASEFGRLPLTESMAAAISYAEHGHAVAPSTAKAWTNAHAKYSRECSGEEFKPWFDTFCPNGRAPSPGELWRSGGHASALEAIARSGAEEFYRGRLAERIDEYARRYGAWLSGDDLAEYRPEWVEPIMINYRGYDVWEIPPNGHGISALMALGILKGFDFSGSREYAPTYHRLIEAMKLAFVDTRKHVADPRFMKYTAAELLSEAYAADRRALIGEKALDPEPGTPPAKGGTVYLCTADEDGNMVSMIQSNYMGFGSGLVVPGLGIALQNRGSNFNLDPESPNCLAPSKKPYHTIIPGFLTKDGKPIGPFGVMGGFMQPQGHVQVVTNLVDFAMNPQEALDAPRWQWTNKRTVELEQGVPNHIALDLASRGHDIIVKEDPTSFGRGEMILRTEQGTLVGATEPRTDGCVAAW